MRPNLPALFLLLALGAAAPAQEGSATPTQEPVALKLQIDFSRYAGEKKIAGAPYTLSLTAAGPEGVARLRMGIQVPIRVGDKEGKSSVVYHDVGNNVDCWAEPLGSRFRVHCSFDQSALYSPEGQVAMEARETSASDIPIFRNFRAEAFVALADGQSVQVTSATDPVSGEVLEVDLTLNVVK